MIHERLDRSYLVGDPRLTVGFDWLRANADPTPGRHELAGGAYAMVADYETTPGEGKKFEAHRRFIDIQLLVTGEEIIDVAPLELEGIPLATPYDDENDIAFYGDPPRWSSLAMAPGLFAVFYPDDAHRPGNALPSGPKPVRKAVVKIPVENR